jgi:hypothetical protein
MKLRLFAKCCEPREEGAIEEVDAQEAIEPSETPEDSSREGIESGPGGAVHSSLDAFFEKMSYNELRELAAVNEPRRPVQTRNTTKGIPRDLGSWDFVDDRLPDLDSGHLTSKVYAERMRELVMSSGGLKASVEGLPQSPSRLRM